MPASMRVTACQIEAYLLQELLDSGFTPCRGIKVTRYCYKSTTTIHDTLMVRLHISIQYYLLH